MDDTQSTFNIQSWNEEILQEWEGGSMREAKVRQAYHGHLRGESDLVYLMTYTEGGRARFVGTELFEGTVGEREGRMSLHHEGTFENGVARSTCRVVPGSGTGELEGISGEGRFEADGNKVAFRFSYEMD
ncbi:MAG: DUF3224 domain-containing protein [Balneolaceae bacterium]|nr:DUF3224 domain-containing protein [Balneolaceae bacterium]